MKQKEFNPAKENFTDTHMTELRELLKGSGTPLEWIIAPEESTKELNDDLIEKFSIEFILERSSSRDSFFTNAMINDSIK